MRAEAEECCVKSLALDSAQDEVRALLAQVRGELPQ
jgi:hypothetical protein